MIKLVGRDSYLDESLTLFECFTQPVGIEKLASESKN